MNKSIDDIAVMPIDRIWISLAIGIFGIESIGREIGIDRVCPSIKRITASDIVASIVFVRHPPRRLAIQTR